MAHRKSAHWTAGKNTWRIGSSSRVRWVTGRMGLDHGSLSWVQWVSGLHGFLGQRARRKSLLDPPENSLEIAAGGPGLPHGSAGHGSGCSGSLPGLTDRRLHWVYGSLAHRRSHSRRPLASSAPPIGGSDSISLNSPDLISLSQHLSVSLSIPYLPLSRISLSLDFSHSLYCCLCGSLGRRTKKKKK